MPGVGVHPTSDDRVSGGARVGHQRSTPAPQLVVRPSGRRERFCVYETVTTFTPRHFHTMVEVMFVQQGAGVQRIGSQIHEVRPHMLALVPPNMPHSLTCVQPVSKLVCMFDIAMIDVLLAKGHLQDRLGMLGEQQSTAVQLSADEAELVAGLFAELIAERGAPDRLAGAITAALIVRIIVQFFRRATQPMTGMDTLLHEEREDDQYHRITSLLQRRFTDPINRATVAKSLGVRPETVSRAFAGTGETFTGYLTQLRLGHALELLQNSSHSATEISRLSGFDSYRTFTRAFHRQFGQSPGTLRDTTS